MDCGTGGKEEAEYWRGVREDRMRDTISRQEHEIKNLSNRVSKAEKENRALNKKLDKYKKLPLICGICRYDKFEIGAINNGEWAGKQPKPSNYFKYDNGEYYAKKDLLYAKCKRCSSMKYKKRKIRWE